jgi:hypothetical protein
VTEWYGDNTVGFVQRFAAWRRQGLEAQMFIKPQMFIEVQMFNLPRQPCFCQTVVRRSAFLSTANILHFLQCLCMR